MPFYSKNLKRILNIGHTTLDQQINLPDLASKISDIFADKRSLALMLFATATGQIKMGTIELYLLDVLKHDSVVRDIETTGHLAKLICRLDVFHKASDSRVFGMPNQLFDDISQAERADFFKAGNILEIDGELLDLPDVRALMDREAKIFQRFK